MPEYHPTIPAHLITWALSQPIFFTASAPLHGRHINLSPKGHPSTSLRILNPNLCAYLDATGSGNETIAHVREPGNGRVTVMFCGFGEGVRILRFFCRGEVVEWDEKEKGDGDGEEGEKGGGGAEVELGFEGWVRRMGLEMQAVRAWGARAVVVLRVWKVQTSCGYGVPRLALKPDPTDPSQPLPYLQDRHNLPQFAAKMLDKGQLRSYQRDWNHDSLDGLPGLRAAIRDRGERLPGWEDYPTAWLRRNARFGALLALVAVLSALGTVGVMRIMYGEGGCAGKERGL